MTSYRIGKLLCQMCCCSTKQSLQAERLFQRVATFYVLSGLKDKYKLHSLEKAFLKLNTFAVNKKSHLRNLNMQAAYKIHAGFLQHIQEIFKDQAVCCLLVLWSFWRCEQLATASAVALPSSGSRAVSDPVSHVSSKVAVLCQGTSALLPCGKDSSSYRYTTRSV